MGWSRGPHAPPRPLSRAHHFLCGPTPPLLYGQVVCPLGPAVVLHPSFAPSASVLRERVVRPEAVSISQRSTLLIKVTGGDGSNPPLTASVSLSSAKRKGG